MRKYELITNQNLKEVKGIYIDGSAKEDFKEMMNWSEEEFELHTKEIFD